MPGRPSDVNVRVMPANFSPCRNQTTWHMPLKFPYHPQRYHIVSLPIVPQLLSLPNPASSHQWLLSFPLPPLRCLPPLPRGSWGLMGGGRGPPSRPPTPPPRWPVPLPLPAAALPRPPLTRCRVRKVEGTWLGRACDAPGALSAAVCAGNRAWSEEGSHMQLQYPSCVLGVLCGVVSIVILVMQWCGVVVWCGMALRDTGVRCVIVQCAGVWACTVAV